MSADTGEQLAVELQVGDRIVIHWSNGHGYSVYKIVDTPLGNHDLELVREVEYV